MIANVSGWTLETLKEHFDAINTAKDARQEQRFKDSQMAVEAALNAAKEAVAKAEAASEKRFESVNEFRAQMGDQQRTLMPRSEAELRMSGIETHLTELSRIISGRNAEQKGSREVWGYVVGVAGILIAVATYFTMLLRKP
jgi:small-conductance mechanosensitive channel